MRYHAGCPRVLELLLVLALACFWQLSASAQPEERLHAELDRVAPEKPSEVSIGVRVDQIVSIHQKDENFEVVGNLRMQWRDPKLGFDARKYGQSFRMFSRDAFVKFAEVRAVFVTSVPDTEPAMAALDAKFRRDRV